jgi:putative endonuclease
MPYRQRIGNWGEKVAKNFLVRKGLIPIAANLRTQYGEIDLIMKDGSTIVFIEVKTRTNMKYGLPEVSITRQKQSHIKKSAEFLMQEHPEWGDNWRIDVLAISGRPADPDPEIFWFENAVE